MKHLVINAEEFKVSDLSPFHFGWANGINTKALETMRRQSNLEIVCPHENKVHQYHYFFDIRDCNDPGFRPQGETSAEILEFVSREICDLQSRVRDIKDYRLEDSQETIYDKLGRIYSRMDKLQEEIYEIAEQLK